MTDDVGGARRGGKRVGLAGRGRTSRGGGSPPRRWCGWRPRRIRGGCWNGGRRRRRSGSRRSPGAQPASSRKGRASVVSSKCGSPRGRRRTRRAPRGRGRRANGREGDSRTLRRRSGRARADARDPAGSTSAVGDPRGVPRRLKHGSIVPVGAPASRRRGPTRGPPRRGSPPGGGTAPEPRGRSERQTSRAEVRVASPRRPVGYDARARPRHPDEDSRGALRGKNLRHRRHPNFRSGRDSSNAVYFPSMRENPSSRPTRPERKDSRFERRRVAFSSRA